MLPLIEQLLRKRGIEDLEKFLNPSRADLSRPEALPGIEPAAAALLAAVSEKRPVVVFGDYDCDGICATAIMVRTLLALGARVEAFLPNRLSEGYGMSDKSIARMLREYPDVGLVVTVDNGINSVEVIENLKARHGIDTIVTDHHLPGPVLPSALALVNPKVAAPAQLQNLCGAGVAYLLAQSLIERARATGLYQGPKFGGSLFILAGLATVTDIMPLISDNRILVAEALANFSAWAPVGLKELYSRAARTGTSKMTSRDFSFIMGPRINAAGRMKDGLEALELLLSDDREIARELARIIDGYNVERKAVEQRMTEQAMQCITDENASAQVIDLPDGHPGVAGIVAARVMERLGGKVPVCVLASGHGSARSPDGLNIRDAFVACNSVPGAEPVLDTFGGHAAAGGFSVLPGKIDEFRRRLVAYCDEEKERKEQQTDSNADGPGADDLPVDIWLSPSDITLELAEALLELEPYGEGNPEPVFGLRGVYFSEVRPIGADGKHLSVQLRNLHLQAVQWNRGDLVEALRRDSARPHDVAFTIAVSEYGERHVELRLQGIN